jgi:4-hydroxythreonine-4-phosphate dehydrogenase
MSHLKPLLVTSGEPAGIGPDILLDVATRALPMPIVAVGSKDLLQARAKMLGLEVCCVDYSHKKPIDRHTVSELPVVDIPLRGVVIPGVLAQENASYVIEMLLYAARACFSKEFSAVVTCPVQKSIINESGIAFSGQTEFFAQTLGVSDVVMMLAIQELKVALMTTHLPLSHVSSAITQESIIKKVKIIHQDLIHKFQISHPKLLLCGLNPHAGELGHLGTEELTIINPAARTLRDMGIDISDALPADTVFTQKYRETADVIIAMYHDQGLPVIKALGFGECSNITLGLPIIRTSVDHGTALSLAATGQASAESLYHTLLLTMRQLNR